MTLRVETRAARLVAALERQGIAVAGLTISGEEIKVTFAGRETDERDAFDLIDFSRRKPNAAKTKK